MEGGCEVRQRLKPLGRKELGRYLRHYRKRAGLSAREVAAHLGYADQQSVYNVESGKTSLSIERLYEALSIYGVDPDEAFTEPFEEVDNPSKAKRRGSVRENELRKVFADLDNENQRIVLRVARGLLAGQSESSGEDRHMPL